MNDFLCSLSLRRAGVLNYQNDFLMGLKAWLISYLSKMISPVFIDIGDYSCTVFQANANSTVVAFETHPKTYTSLIENIEEENFTSSNSRQRDESSVMKLFGYEGCDGLSHVSLYKSVIKELQHAGEPVSHLVEVVRPGSFLEKNSIEFIVY